jgi:hypothetical protein
MMIVSSVVGTVTGVRTSICVSTCNRIGTLLLVRSTDGSSFKVSEKYCLNLGYRTRTHIYE